MEEDGYEPFGGTCEEPLADFNEELDLAEGFDLTDHDVLQGLVSLDAPIGDERGGTLGDYIVDSASLPQPEDADIGAMRERLARALDALPEAERMVMSLRFGQEDGNPRTLDEIYDEIGVKPEDVRRIEARLLARLRNGHHGTNNLSPTTSTIGF